ncbi:hypothetical protein [Rummeliibacillus pycnus]|uniref:hypothetical protein n=1 Tax=Rummeliibacillus pycnus TaxID=101070 RepID=UPI0037C94EDF
MKIDKWIPLANINDKSKIWAGTRVRLYNVGLNVEDRNDDYYEYLVSYIYDNAEFLQLTNLSPEEAGNIICILQKDLPNHYALGKTLKKMIGVENTFVLEE